MSNIYVITEGPYSSPIQDIKEWFDFFEIQGVQVGQMFEDRPIENPKVITDDIFAQVYEKQKHFPINEDLKELQPKVILIFGKNACNYYFNEDWKKVLGQSKMIEIDGNQYLAFGFGSTLWMRNNKWTSYSKLVDATNKAVFESNGVSYEQSTGFKYIHNRDEFHKVLDYCKETGTFCFDFETTGLDYFREEQKPTILSICFQHGFSYILPLYHFESWFNEEDIQYFFKVIGEEIFNNIKVNKIAHNLKFDLHWMRRFGVDKYDGRFNDTMLMSHILDENTKNGLKDLARKYFIKFSGYENELKKEDGSLDKFSWETVPLELLSKYAALDTDLTLRLYHMFEEMLIEDGISLKEKRNILTRIQDKFVGLENGEKLTPYKGLTNIEYLEYLETIPYRLYLLYRNLTMPAFFALFDAEHHGCKIDSELIRKSIKEAEIILEKKSKQLHELPEIKKFEILKRKQINEARIELLEEKIKARLEKYKPGTALEVKYRDEIQRIKSGELDLYEGINFSSPTQLKEFLFTPMGLNLKGMWDERKKEYTLTTKREFLAEIDHPFVILLLSYRSIASMLSTFYEGILERLDSNDIVHTSFLLHGTTTGRLASRGPNLQNIPARIKFKDEEAEKVLKMVKKFFIALSENHYMLQADYSQAELRVIANFSGDPTMVDAYKHDKDLHAITASNELGLTFEQFMELPPDEVKKHRTAAKGTNFGLVFDMSIQGYLDYARNNYGVVMTYEEAEKKYKAFFKMYSKLKEWHRTYVKFAEKYGYVRTLFGRKRRLLSIQSKEDTPAKGMDIRASINSPIQGTSGEYAIFSAAIMRHRMNATCPFVNTVHDSVFFYPLITELDKNIPLIMGACENPPIQTYFGIYPGEVGMKMDLEISDKSWGDMVPIEKFQK